MTLTFNITYDSSVDNAPAGFKAGINAVTQFFTSHFTDSITVNINVGYGTVKGQALDSGAIGESISFYNSYTYAQLRTALAGDAKSTDDATAVGTLPVSAPISGSYWTTQTEAKAMGLAGQSSAVDGYVGFSNVSGFDYDNSNGVTAGQYDFFGAVAHEFSEVMGRQLAAGDTSLDSQNGFVALDLFHYSAPGVRDFTSTQPGYFSINGGTTSLHSFNTDTNGDAGDWASGAGLDAANAFGTTGATEPFSATDLTALDVIGWDLDHPPVLSAWNVLANRGQSFSAANLFTVVATDNAITKYEFADGTDDSASGHFVVNGTIEPANQVIDVSAAQLAQSTFQSGPISDVLGVRAFDGFEWGDWTIFNVNALDHAPVATAPNVTAARGQSFAASSLFTATDADSDPITKYQFADGTADSASGHFVVNGTVEPANQVIDVSAAGLAQTSFQSGSGSDALGVRAFDGFAWGSWTIFNVSAPVNHAPVATAPNATATHGQSFVASSLFAVSDVDGDPITHYQFADGTADPASGYFVVNGTIQAANQVIDVPAAQLAQTSFQSGSVSDVLGVRAFDGLGWSAWAIFNVNAPVNHAPVVTATTVTASHGQSFAAASLFTATDVDGDAITQYQFADGTADPASGHFVVNGTVEPANQVIDVPAAQLGQTSFQSGSGSDVLGVRAFDGLDWSAWGIFNVNAPIDRAPVATAGDASLVLNTSVAASTLFTVADADNDMITKFEFADGNANLHSGHFALNGVAQPANQVIDVLATALNQASFVAGDTSGSDLLGVRAFDGWLWSDWHFFTATSHA